MPDVKAILWKAVGMVEIPTPLQSARDKGGRRFQPDKEQELEESALRACLALPGAGHGLIVLKEVVGALGIPDLVAVVGDERAVSGLTLPPLMVRS